MKKILSVLFIACIAMLFASCHKDGVYNPSKKISKIYYTDDGGNKSLRQVWTWNKNNTLEKIDYYSGGTLSYTYNFTYEKKRLVRMNNYAANSYAEYKYDNNGLKEVNVYSGGTLNDTYTFTHKNGNIVKIIDTYLDSKSADQEFNKNSLQFVLPEELYTAAVNAQKKFKVDEGKSTRVYTYELTWEKGNITKLTETVSGSSANITYVIKYDNKKNPYYGACLNRYYEDNVTGGYLCKNNVTSGEETYVDEDGVETDMFNYEYTYDGQYPISRRYMGNNYTTLTEFEYTK